LDSLNSKIEKDSKKIKKMEQKCDIATRGYALRLSKYGHVDEQNVTALNHGVVDKLNQSVIELEYFEKLRSDESSVLIPKRLGEAKRLSERAEQIESELQAKYANAVAVRNASV